MTAAREHCSGAETLARLGVTWLQVSVPGDSVAHAVEVIERFGSAVIKGV
ncbi:hypothetical protein [Mycobacterium sp. URHB0021]